MPQEYERDEFDEIADQGGPVGVHRRPIPWWSRVLPPILAFLVAGLIAYGIAVLVWNSGRGSDDPEPSVTVTSTPDPTASSEPSASAETSVSPSASASPSASPSTSVSPSAEAEPEIVLDAQVHVRNGAGVTGLAGEQQAILEDEGFTNVEANNISSSDIPDGVNTVAYDDERLADTAQAIADALGIEAVDGSGTPGGAEIEVLLASDPS
ncbi:MAG: LytR C-terminal domain-containing protein [Demequina sp.]|uniref:LytR C-terminal domain-containing protein n=1 Tax=Demequina sp. TaxID=2050685 RepID=UPI003A860140